MIFFFLFTFFLGGGTTWFGIASKEKNLEKVIIASVIGCVSLFLAGMFLYEGISELLTSLTI